MSERKVTQAIFDAICDQIADGLSMRQACALPGMPHRRNVLRALAQNEQWQVQYAIASKMGREAWADDIVAVATTPRLGKKTKTITVAGKKVTETTEGDMVDRSRLEVDAKKWILSKLEPKKYGDRIEMQVDASVQGTVNYQANIPPRGKP
ncbi:terminase small subunit protein [Methylibium sp. Pch-M]|uniref:terminase small subunit-like protein n=1 Tax=Methylibium sp. Pch-M TaxID=2082386 RepID=UPI001010417D|nr:terminase small subunit protein [Methylibium sp. Pch-M]QAZ38442.1 terminase small subunit protein [Methylibium sp. Pch-M]